MLPVPPHLQSFLIAILVAFLACDSSGPPTGPVPSGPAPFVEFDVTFGEPLKQE